MCMIDDADPMTFCRQSMRRAGREHTCCECGRAIEKGETYSNDAGLFEGHWYTYKTCLHCVSGPRAWLLAQCGGWCYHGIYEDMRDHRDEWLECGEGVALLRYIIGMQRKWLKKDGTMMDVPEEPGRAAGVKAAAS